MVATVDDLPDHSMQGDVMLLYLPLAHNFGRLLHLAGPYAGYTVAFCPDPYAVADALPVVRPTVLPSVPRVYEKIHGNVAAAFAAETGPKRRIIDWGTKTSSGDDWKPWAGDRRNPLPLESTSRTPRAVGDAAASGSASLRGCARTVM
jgi:long-subunit acyl-CoA synthetase (AMP-forming)